MIPFVIFDLPCFLSVLAAVNFQDQSFFKADEVYNVSADGVLPSEP